MSKLPNISGRKCVVALQHCGFRIRRQTGSHVVMQRDEPYVMVVVPNHKLLKSGTLRSIIRQAGLTVDEFVDLL
jgi:predicted RNA binding protein YcfA (HicA-like mRNA interferase family)